MVFTFSKIIFYGFFINLYLGWVPKVIIPPERFSAGIMIRTEVKRKNQWVAADSIQYRWSLLDCLSYQSFTLPTVSLGRVPLSLSWSLMFSLSFLILSNIIHQSAEYRFEWHWLLSRKNGSTSFGNKVKPLISGSYGASQNGLFNIKRETCTTNSNTALLSTSLVAFEIQLRGLS